MRSVNHAWNGTFPGSSAFCELGAMRMQNWVHCTIIELDLLVSLGGRQVHRGSTAAYLSICFVRNLGLNHDGVKNVRGNTCVVAPFLREDAMDIVSFFV